MIVIDVKFVPAGMNDWLPLPINREAFLRALTVTVLSDGALPYEVVTEGVSSGRLSNVEGIPSTA